MVRTFALLLLLCLSVDIAAQDLRLPRTIKAYPLSLVRSELLLGYEHGLKPRMSLSIQLGVHGSGLLLQVQDPSAGSGASVQCQQVWPASGFSFKAGPRFYPSRKKRQAPFYIEALLSYRRTQYPEFNEYQRAPCVPGTNLSKRIEPLQQRWGIQYILGGALRRDRRFTLDMYGGLGTNILFTNEKQVSDPGLPDPYYRPEPPRSRFLMTAHLGLTLGFNLNGLRRS